MMRTWCGARSGAPRYSFASACSVWCFAPGRSNVRMRWLRRQPVPATASIPRFRCWRYGGWRLDSEAWCRVCCGDLLRNSTPDERLSCFLAREPGPEFQVGGPARGPGPPQTLCEPVPAAASADTALRVVPRLVCRWGADRIPAAGHSLSPRQLAARPGLPEHLLSGRRATRAVGRP